MAYRSLPPGDDPNPLDVSRKDMDRSDVRLSDCRGRENRRQRLSRRAGWWSAVSGWVGSICANVRNWSVFVKGFLSRPLR